MNVAPNREVALFSAALELAASRRGAYLDESCADDPALRQRLGALLRVHEEAINFLDATPPAPQESGRAVESSGSTARRSGAPAQTSGGHVEGYKQMIKLGMAAAEKAGDRI